MRVFITGGSSGIGLETARLYAQRGDDVTICGRDYQKLIQAEQSIAQPIHTCVLDVADQAAVETACADFAATAGAPDLLVNCAGVMFPGEFISMDRARFDANIDVDFLGTVHMCRAFAPLMVERGSGHIVNIASVAGFLGVYGYTGYASAKYAVMGFSEALRFELEPLGVLVTVICPPDTKTPGLELEKTMRPQETDVIAGLAKEVAPELVARKLVSGVDRKKRMVIIGASSKLYYRLKGVWPELFYAIVSNDVRKVRKGRNMLH